MPWSGIVPHGETLFQCGTIPDLNIYKSEKVIMPDNFAKCFCILKKIIQLWNEFLKTLINQNEAKDDWVT